MRLNQVGMLATCLDTNVEDERDETITFDKIPGPWADAL